MENCTRAQRIMKTYHLSLSLAARKTSPPAHRGTEHATQHAADHQTLAPAAPSDVPTGCKSLFVERTLRGTNTTPCMGEDHNVTQPELPLLGFAAAAASVFQVRHFSGGRRSMPLIALCQRRRVLDDWKLRVAQNIAGYTPRIQNDFPVVLKCSELA